MRESNAHDDGIAAGIFSFSTPERALDSLCMSMLSSQSRDDSKRNNLEGRKKVARQVMKEFLEELPN